MMTITIKGGDDTNQINEKLTNLALNEDFLGLATVLYQVIEYLQIIKSNIKKEEL